LQTRAETSGRRGERIIRCFFSRYPPGYTSGLFPNDPHLAQNRDNVQEKNINRKHRSKYIETRLAARDAAGCRGLEFVYKEQGTFERPVARRFLFDGALRAGRRAECSSRRTAAAVRYNDAICPFLPPNGCEGWRRRLLTGPMCRWFGIPRSCPFNPAVLQSDPL